MTAAASPHGHLRAHADVLHEGTALDAGLAIAAGAQGLTFIAVTAPVTTAAAVLEVPVLRADEPRAAWTAGELTIVGLGAARELRGTGADRWAQIVDAARRLQVAGAVIDGVAMPVSALGLARPRLIGGAAFAPGAADRAPWAGFGDAWFMLPRWTYVRHGSDAHLVLAVDARTAGAGRWRDELAQLLAVPAPRAPRPQPALVELQRAGADEWRTQVVDITDAIAAGACSKIVAARTATLQLAGAVRAPDLLATLDQRHAECVRVLIQPPDAGALVAATPEQLVRRDGQLVSCDALAGTRSIGIGDDAARDRRVADASAALLASPKDRREHDLVVDAIR
ncbi:MAG TPA: chorismate-binding protein, partial [Kofleriaceae bacterium]